MHKRGQSIIEYTLIAVLVILGIVIMGPYVLRSVNAHFKLWDDGVQDSFKEKIHQAPVNDVPDISLTCKCPTDTQGDCGDAVVNPSTSGGNPTGGNPSGGGITTGKCAANQRIWFHNCTPQLCDGAPAEYCKYDESCCKEYSPGACGKVPEGLTPPSNSTGTGPSDCNYGQRILATACSTLPIKCQTDSSCDPKCMGVIVYKGSAVFCATGNSTPPSTGLDKDYPITFVGDQTHCGSTKCAAYCVFPYVLNAAGTGCINTFIVAPVIDTPKITTTNDKSFSLCTANPKDQITSASIPNPPGSGCGDQVPDATPGNSCSVQISY